MKNNIRIYDLSRKKLTAATVIGEYENQKSRYRKCCLLLHIAQNL